MFTKLAKHRTFQYTPRYWDPQKEEREHPRIKFRRVHNPKKSRSMFWYIIVIGFVAYLLYLLSHISGIF